MIRLYIYQFLDPNIVHGEREGMAEGYREGGVTINS